MVLQLLLNRFAFCKHHDAGGVTIEAVHDIEMFVTVVSFDMILQNGEGRFPAFLFRSDRKKAR